MAKKRAKKKPETVKIFPDLTPDQAKRLETAVDAKQHAEYLCFMMLDRLSKSVPLEQLLKDCVRRGIVDEDVLQEFFGDPEDQESGCCEAENYTLPELLEHWHDSTEKMLRVVAEAGRGNK
jgi:hypothetical protein